MCIFNELLITLSALLPLMFISHYYLLLAAVEAKIYHLLLSVLFIRYQKRYRYFINKYLRDNDETQYQNKILENVALSMFDLVINAF